MVNDVNKVGGKNKRDTFPLYSVLALEVSENVSKVYVKELQATYINMSYAHIQVM